MGSAGASNVAKKKAEAEKPTDDRDIVLSMKGTSAFRDWLTELAESERMKVVPLMERAIVEYARKVGFPKPAPKRTK
jgi:hypothetical protein